MALSVAVVALGGFYAAAEDQPAVTTLKAAPAAAMTATAPAAPATADDPTVYITKTGKKYHRGSCSYLKQSKIAIKLSEAKRQGYGACSRCKPPTSSADVAEPPASTTEDPTVYITKTGKKYHRGSCSYLKKSKISIKLSQAKKQGYGPCSRCKPPT